MKTKFFKKLSFVLAVAMVLSVFAPAAGAFAAGEPKLNSTKKYLHLSGKPGSNEFNFNIKNKVKGWKYFWESADEAVAEVNEKNGVVIATGVGKTKITCTITDADGEEVAELVATVTVRDNIETVTIKNPVEKLNVGEEHDYNRSFVTLSGSTKKTSSVTRWTVEPEGAEIDDKGVFKASAPGKYTVTALSFQSQAKYDDWKADPEKYADYVLDTDTTEVTVAAFMVEAKQKDLTSVNVLFSSPMTEEEVKDNIYVNYMIHDVAIKEQAIKGISMSADGLTATVEIYDYFVPKVTYRVTYTGMDYKQFEAATTNPEDVVAIDITTETAKIYEDTTVKFNLLNKDGVVINQPADVSNLNSRVTFENSNELTSLIGDQLMIFNKGDNTTVTATYHTYDYDNSGNETVYTDSQIIVGTEDGDAVATSILAWTITTGEPKWDDVKHFIAAGDAGRNLYVQVVLNNNNDTKDNSFANPHMFRLTSSDSSILFTDEWGTLVPVKAGSVRVTVEYDEKFVGAFEVVVSAERKAARLEVKNAYYANVSNSMNFDPDVPWTDEQTVEVNLLDQYGDKLADNVAYAPNIFVRPLSAKAKLEDGDADISMEGTAFIFDPGEVEQGKYQYLFYDAAYPNFTGTVTFDVKAPVEPDEAKSYKVSFVGTSFDKNGNVDVVVKTADDIDKTIEVQLMAYAKNGIKLGLVSLEDYELVVKDSKGKEIPEDAKDANDGVFYATWVSGGVIQKLATGRYTVDVMDGTKVVARGIFVVVDSQTLPTYSIKALRSDETSAKAAFNDCFTVKIGDDTIDIDDMDPVFVTTSIPTRAYVKEVLVYKEIIEGAATLELKKTVDKYVYVPIDFDGYAD